MTSFDLLALIREIRPKVTDSHLVNVYEVAPNLLILKLRTKDAENHHLLLQAGRRIHLTNTRYKTPQVLPAFCATLRRYLRNGILTQISQRDLDRFVILEFKNGSTLYKLVVELLERGSIVLTDSNLTIIASSATKGSTTRLTGKGDTYTFPRIRGLDFEKASVDDAYKLIHASKSDTVRSLVQFLNLPGEIAEEVSLRAGISKDRPAYNLTDEDVRLALDQTRLLAKEIVEEPLQPLLIRSKESIESVIPRRLQVFGQLQGVEFESFSEALEEYFQQAERMSRSQREAAADARWQHVIASQTESAHKLTEEAKRTRELGSLIFAQLSQLDQFLDALKGEKVRLGDWRRASQSIQHVSKKNTDFQLEAVDPRTGRVSLRVSDALLELDPSKGAAANASEYYERAKEAEAKAKRALEAVDETKRKLQVASVNSRKKRVESEKTLARRHWYERFRWFISSEGFLAIGGRDASQNETLIKKHLEPNDIVFHADVQGAPFVIIKKGERIIGEMTLEEAAQFAVSYSSAWRGGLGSADAYWVDPVQVSKSAPSGEYLGKGAFMIRGEKNIRKGVKLGVTLGVQLEEGELRILAGPERAVRAHSKISVNVIPGDIPSQRFAPQLRYRLAQLLSASEATEIKRLHESEFLRFLPQGGSRFEQSNS